MSAIVFDLFVLGALVYAAVLGSTVGTYRAAAAALAIYVAFALAVLLHEPIAGFLTPLLVDNVAPFLPESVSLPSWTIFLVFAALFWGTFLAFWINVYPEITKGWPETAALPQADRFGGAVAGWFAGILLVGGVMVTVSMLPFGFLRFPSRNMLLDVGRTVLRGVAPFTRELHDGRSLVLYGEPSSRESVTEARLTSEPWHDSNGDGKFDDSDVYYDADGSGSFTKDLYYLDVDTNLHRRVGLVEKYVVGRWDLQLTSSDRERGEKPQAAAKPPVKDPRNPADRSLPPPPPEETVVVPPLTVPNIPSLPSLPTPSAAGATTPQKPTKPVTAPPTDDF